LSLFDSHSVAHKNKSIKFDFEPYGPKHGSIKISLLHVIYDTRIWPSFIDSSPERIKENILIGSLSIDQESLEGYVFIDDSVKVITYKSKTVQNVLSEIAGALVLLRVFTLILSVFHEQRFISKMKKETKEEFREVFTYENFKRLMIKNQELEEKINKI
jgi:hypothetical protein